MAIAKRFSIDACQTVNIAVYLLCGACADLMNVNVVAHWICHSVKNQ